MVSDGLFGLRACKQHSLVSFTFHI